MLYKPGDIVLYTSLQRGQYLGAVIKHTETMLTIQFGKDYQEEFDKHPVTHYAKEHFNRFELHMTNNLTSVERRIQKLWNQSNWVKNNPEKAYV